MIERDVETLEDDPKDSSNGDDELEIAANQERAEELLKELQDLNQRTNQKKAILKAKSSLEKNCKHQND